MGTGTQSVYQRGLDGPVAGPNRRGSGRGAGGRTSHLARGEPPEHERGNERDRERRL